MGVIPFPSPVSRYAEEIADALDALHAICVEAADRLTPGQRLDLDNRIIVMAADACAPLTDGLSLEEQGEIVRGVIERLREE